MLLIVLILVLLWGTGFVLNVGGGLLHLLLIIALIVFIYHMVTGRNV